MSNVMADTRPISMFATQPEYVTAVFAELNRRIAPAKLANVSLNGTVLFSELPQGWVPQSVDELADFLEGVIKRILFRGTLKWEVAPKALVGPNQPADSDSNSPAKFAEWTKQAEAKTRYENEQRATEKLINDRINHFLPTTAIGHVDYGMLERKTAKWRGWLADAKKNGTDLKKVLTKIKEEVGG